VKGCRLAGQPPSASRDGEKFQLVASLLRLSLSQKEGLQPSELSASQSAARGFLQPLRQPPIATGFWLLLFI